MNADVREQLVAVSREIDAAHAKARETIDALVARLVDARRDADALATLRADGLAQLVETIVAQKYVILNLRQQKATLAAQA